MIIISLINAFGITKGKKYNVISESGSAYELELDNGNISYGHKDSFIKYLNVTTKVVDGETQINYDKEKLKDYVDEFKSDPIKLFNFIIYNEKDITYDAVEELVDEYVDDDYSLRDYIIEVSAKINNNESMKVI